MQNDTKEIRQHNSITTARYEMSACEMDIFFCLLSELKHDNNNLVFEIPIGQIEEQTGRKWNYQQLKESTKKLNGKVFENETEKSYFHGTIISNAEYIKGTGRVEIEISSKVKPYLLDLKEKFTSYRLQAVLNLTSKYAKRIYQLASQWKSKGEVQYTISELKCMLHLKDPKGVFPEQYIKISQFKDKVLEVAKNQINEHTELEIDYKLHKKGRAFHSVTFFIRSKAPKLKPVDFKESTKNQKNNRIIEIAKELGIVRKDIIQEIMEDESAQKILRKYANDIKLGNYSEVRNKAAYFIKMMGNHKKDQNGID